MHIYELIFCPKCSEDNWGYTLTEGILLGVCKICGFEAEIES